MNTREYMLKSRKFSRTPIPRDRSTYTRLIPHQRTLDLEDSEFTTRYKNVSRSTNDMKEEEKTIVKRAISSYGIINYTLTEDGQYLYQLCQRRDSISYAEFLKDTLPEKVIKMHINLMSKEERQRCLEYYGKQDFESLWNDLWTNHNNKFYKKEFKRCKEAFFTNMEIYMSCFLEKGGGQPENSWGFPKGRKHQSESELSCALREFEEETTIRKELLHVMELPPFEEIYNGTDDKLYRTVYFLAYIKSCPKIHIKQTPDQIRKNLISDEVSKLGWFSYGEAQKRLDTQKRKILEEVNCTLLFSKKSRSLRRKTY